MKCVVCGNHYVRAVQPSVDAEAGRAFELHPCPEHPDQQCEGGASPCPKCKAKEPKTATEA
jgi:hypothetical protein